MIFCTGVAWVVCLATVFRHDMDLGDLLIDAEMHFYMRENESCNALRTTLFPLS